MSLAVNYAFGKTNPWGYHAVNLAIHILAALALFGVIRRTLLSPGLRKRFDGRSAWLALAAALIWLVHPLQTESVTYISQRAESLAGLLYLATLYFCIRAFQGDKGLRWQVAAVTSCLVGMATKETMVTAPLLVLLYDRTFASGSFREAWRRHRGMYLGLAASWLLLAVLVIRAGSRGGTAGFGQVVSPWDYASTQFGAIVHYLRLCFWPDTLSLDYGTALTTQASQVVPYAILIGLLVIATVVSLWYWPWAGFLGAWFFLILAPSSSLVPVVTQTMAEHRMYLPLAAVVVFVVMLADRVRRRILSSISPNNTVRTFLCRTIPMAVAVALVAAETCLTVFRNNDYRSVLTIYSDGVRKTPQNSRAHYNLGTAMFAKGFVADAITQYEQALRLRPDFTEAFNNLGLSLASKGRFFEAITYYEQALKLKPDSPDALNNLGFALASTGRVAEAIEKYEEALKLRPDFPEARTNLGLALASMGLVDEAIAQHEQVLNSRPDYVDVRINLGAALASKGRISEAIVQYEQALNLAPDSAAAHNNLGLALAAKGQVPEAIAQYEQALKWKPDYPEAHYNMGIALFLEGAIPDAISHYEQALKLRPNYVNAHNNLGMALASQGQVDDAISHYEQAMKLEPNLADLRNNLGGALASKGRLHEAIEQYEHALKLKPDYADAHYNLGLALVAQGRPSEAVRHFERAVQLNPNDAGAKRNLNMALELYRTGASTKNRSTSRPLVKQ
jgi:tetratricopeptide (TPR) repeat protein